MWEFTPHHVASKHRDPETAAKPEDLEFRCVDVAGHRLFLVLFDPAKTLGVMLSWGNPGLGLSVRGAEMLLPGIEGMVEVPCEPVPEPTWTPEGPAHQGLKERIVELLQHAAIDPAKITCTPKDVYLYPTGMGAVFHTTNLLLEYRPGTVVVAGIAFHNTYHHLVEESPHGWKHNGRVDKQGLDDLEAWLEGEKAEGRMVSYVLVEAPGNPTLDTPDLPRMKKLVRPLYSACTCVHTDPVQSEKYGFVLIADDTIAGFGNVDLLAHSDILLTSLTKSFNGYADAMGGSVVLNPLSPHYGTLSSLFASKHHNELFSPEAEAMLSNSQDFFARTQLLNRNARAMANFLHESMSDPASPVVNVQYPSLLPSKANYDALMRKPSPEVPEPGYGCMFTVDFESINTAAAFYDSCGFYSSPHLGAHVTLMLPYNMFIFTKKAEEAAYMRTLGVKGESVRIAAGLEDEKDLVDTVQHALKAAIEVKKNGDKRETSS